MFCNCVLDVWGGGAVLGLAWLWKWHADDGPEDPLYAKMLKCQVMCTNYTYIAQSSVGLITITKVVSITRAAGRRPLWRKQITL